MEAFSEHSFDIAIEVEINGRETHRSLRTSPTHDNSGFPIAERVGFDAGFLLAGAATVSLLSANAAWVFSSRVQGVRALAIFSLLYALIYLLLRLEDNALLVGAITSFLAVAAAMYFTRRIDWYGSLPAPGIAAQQTVPEVPKDRA